MDYELVSDEHGVIAGPDYEPYLRLSRVGFDTTQRRAVFHYDFVCGLCGDGGYVVMVREGGSWKISEDVNLWVS